MYPYSGRPDKVMSAIELGFDLFTGCYPYMITMKNEATLFEFKMDDQDEQEEPVPAKRRRLKSDEQTKQTSTGTPISIDLSDKK